MVEYSKVNVKLSDTQLKKLKTAVKNKTGATLRITLRMFDGDNLPHELLLTTRQKTKLRNAFNNNMSTDIKLSKRLMQEFKTKIHGSGATTLIISNEEMNDIMKIVQALEDFHISLKGITETNKNETREQKGGFLSMLLGTLGPSLLRNLLSGKRIKVDFENKKGKEIVRAGYGNKIHF